MIKKLFPFMAFILACIPSLSALDIPFSVGGGIFATDFVTMRAEGYHIYSDDSRAFTRVNASATGVYSGVFVFFDAKYVETGLTALFGETSNGKSKTVVENIDMPVNNSFVDTREGILGVNLLFKYPIIVYKFTLFPLLGVDYHIYLYRRSNAEDLADDMYGIAYKKAGETEVPAMDLNNLRLKAGAGVDYPLTQSLFIRGEVSYNFKIMQSDADKKQIGFLQEPEQVGDDADIFGWSGGPVVKIGVGYTFPKPSRTGAGNTVESWEEQEYPVKRDAKFLRVPLAVLTNLSGKIREIGALAIH